jgi:hypothetical protein
MPHAANASLETRLRRVEDQLAIYQVVATYGPAVDSLSGGAVADLWQTDGIYDPGGLAPFTGAREVGDLVDQEPHQSYVAAGCGHVLSLPHVTIDGDRAVATNHSRVYRREGDRWQVVRLSANRWELVREGPGWKVARRTNRLLDGSSQSRELLAAGFRG